MSIFFTSEKSIISLLTFNQNNKLAYSSFVIVVIVGVRVALVVVLEAFIFNIPLLAFFDLLLVPSY